MTKSTWKKTGKGTGITIFKELDDGRDRNKRKIKEIKIAVPDYRNIWARPTYNPATDSDMGSMTQRRSI